MKPSKDLFELIKSFTASEIRHFRQGARRYGPESDVKKYLQLFEAIHAQSQYDEAALKAKLVGVISAGSFSSWKRHLREYLENSIREFYSGRESEEKIHEWLRVAELLSRRGLWRQGADKLQDCKRMALALDDTVTLLKVNDVERRILLEFGRSNIAEQMQELLEEASKQIQRLREEQEISVLFEAACLLIRLNFDPSDAAVASKVPGLLANPYLADGNLPVGFRARRQYHQARAFLFHLSNHSELEYQEYLSLRDHWQAHVIQMSVDTVTYKHSLTNLLHAAFKLRKWEHLEEVAAAMAQWPAKDLDEAAEEFQTLNLYRLLYLLDMRQLGNALRLCNEFEAGLDRFADKVNQARWLAFKVNMVMACFLADEFSAANSHLQMILGKSRSEHRPDLYALARMMEPMVTMELSGVDHQTQGRIHTLREWLRSHDRLREFEKIVLGQLEKVVRAWDDDRKAAFGRMAAGILRFTELPASPQGAELFHVWAEARAAGSPIRPFFERRGQVP